MIKRNYRRLHGRFRRYTPPVIYDNVIRHRMIIKYLVSGGTSTSVDIFIYTVLTYSVGLWYVFSSMTSFIMAFWISFSLQKFWTFEDKATHKIVKQTYLYFFVAITNLGLSTFFIYLFVDYFHIHKFLSKILINMIIAAESFFVYRHFIFAKRDKTEIGKIGQELNLP